MIVIFPIVAYFCLLCNIIHCNNSHNCFCRHRHMLLSRISEYSSYSYPPRSPNMTPLDSIICGHMTYKCFRNQIPDNIDQLKTNVEIVLLSINNNGGGGVRGIPVQRSCLFLIFRSLFSLQIISRSLFWEHSPFTVLSNNYSLFTVLR